MKEKEKENKTGRFLILFLLILLIAVILGAQTYAKYKVAKSGTDVAIVAKWSIKVGGKNITSQDSITFDLFNTIKDTDGNDETDVATVEGKKLIAPGTNGSFEMAVKNESEVKAKYKMTYNIENTSNIPLEFSTNKTDWTKDISTINNADYTVLGIGAEGTTTPIYWRWAFSDSTGDTKDNKDTELATLDVAPTITIEATIEAEQVD